MIDVIVVTYNQLAILRQSLYNLKRNAGMPCRVTVVSDGSTDGTNKWLESKEAKLFYDQIIFKENGGVSSAFNCGIANTSECVIVTHHSDTILYDGWLVALSRVWSSDKFQIISTAFNNITSKVSQDEDFPLTDYSSFPYKTKWRWPKNPDRDLEAKIIDEIPVWLARPHGNLMMMCSRGLYRKLGGYVEFGSYGCNDAEFLDRAKRAEIKFAILQKSILHLMQTNKALLAGRTGSIRRNKERLKKKQVSIPTYEEVIEKYKGKF